MNTLSHRSTEVSSTCTCFLLAEVSQEGAVNGMHGSVARSLLRYGWRHSVMKFRVVSLPCQEAVRSRSCGINYVSGTMAEAPLYFKLRWH